jgi:hypothetical protein
MSVVYDTGVLVAADRNDRRFWADHRARLELGVVPVTTAPVVAQASRSVRQVALRRFLRGCQVEQFRAEQAHEVGALLGQAGSSDVVDGHVVVVAAARSATIWSSDVGDLRRLAAQLQAAPEIRRL